MTGVAAPRARMQRPERRAAIIDGAAAAFARGGYAATSMAEVAGATGVSHLIVYRHFESKDALYEAVLARALGHLADALSDERAAGRYGPTPATVLGTARADRAAFEVLWRHATREPEFACFAQQARDLLRAASETALAPLVPLEHLRWAVRATTVYVVEAVLVWVEDGDPRFDERFVAATDAAIRAGVRSWAKSS